MTGSFIKSDVRIFVFNIDRFNKEDVNMKKDNEFIGSSFYKYISQLDGTVFSLRWWGGYSYEDADGERICIPSEEWEKACGIILE